MSSFAYNPGYENRMREFATTQPRNLNTSHPLIPSSQEYMIYNKYVSIHSEDRDIINYPSSSDFEIELPEDIINVSTIKLVDWTFPANYDTFSLLNNNISFSFAIKNPYNPSVNGVTDVLTYRIFEALFYNENQTYDFVVEEGFYNPDQIVIEMTNKMNATVSYKIEKYFIEKASTDPSWTNSLEEFNKQGGYNRFTVVYNNVSGKIWFGNRADGFTLLNEIGTLETAISGSICAAGRLREFANWGLPGFLGLPRCNTTSVSSSSGLINPAYYAIYNGTVVPRFYYGDVSTGDNGYWLTPYSDLSGSEVYWVEAIYKINLLGEAYFYMELQGHNCIDETKPYNLSNFTLTTNQTNGVVNSAFAKISIPSTPISQWFDNDSYPYKFYYPPAERIRRLKIKLRYHNGRPVNFSNFNYSFVLEFSIMLPMILRDSRTTSYP